MALGRKKVPHCWYGYKDRKLGAQRFHNCGLHYLDNTRPATHTGRGNVGRRSEDKAWNSCWYIIQQRRAPHQCQLCLNSSLKAGDVSRTSKAEEAESQWRWGVCDYTRQRVWMDEKLEREETQRCVQEENEGNRYRWAKSCAPIVSLKRKKICNSKSNT